MKAYSKDLRERILNAFDSGVPKSVIARNFSVCRATVTNYVDLRRETGDIAPRPIPGRPGDIKPDEYPALLAQLQEFPDATLEEHCQKWAQNHGVQVSITVMHRAIERVGWTRKKRHFRRPSRTP